MMGGTNASLQHYTQGEAELTTKRPPGGNGLTNAKEKVMDTKDKVLAKLRVVGQGISKRVDRFAYITTASMAKRPLTHCLSYLGVLLFMALIIFAGGYLEFSQLAQVDFMIIEEEEVRRDFALINAKDQSRASRDFSAEIAIRGEATQQFSLFFLYEKTGSEDLFTPETVQMMCRSEAAILSQEFFPSFCQVQQGTEPNGVNTICAPPVAAISYYFYAFEEGDENPNGEIINVDCPLLTELQVTLGYRKLVSDEPPILGLPNNPGQGSVDDLVNPTLARSTILLAGPLGEDSPPFEIFDQLETKFIGDQGEGGYKIVQDEFRSRILNVVGADGFKQERFSPVEGMDTAVHGFHLSFLEFQAVIKSDTLLALGSFGVVTTLVVVYTRSLFFGLSAMLLVVSTLLAGLFVYGVMFQIRYFNNLHILVLFIIMGIGADNIFVLYDAFRQSEDDVMVQVEADKKAGLFKKPKERDISRVEIGQEAPPEDPVEDEFDEEEMEKEILRRRLHYTYTRSIISVAHTATTTYLAFFATAVSNLAPIASFGIFAGCVILMNLVYMTNILPATLMVYHVYVSPIKLCKKKGEEEEVEQTKKPEPEEPSKPSFGRRMIFKYIHVINHTPFPYFALAFTVSLGIAMTIYAFQLETPTSVESNFRDNHMFTVFQEIFRNSFNSNDDDLLSPVTAVFGVSALNSNGITKFTTDSFRGLAIFDDDFDFFREDTQEFILNFCDELPLRTCDEDGCRGTGKLVAESTIECWLQNFREFSNITTFVTDAQGDPSGVDKEDIIAELDRFLNLRENNGFLQDVGSIGGEIKFVTVRYKKTMQEDQPLGVKIPVLDLFRQLTDDMRAIAPRGCKTFYQTSFDFVWRHTEEELVSGLYSGMAISLFVSFLVVLAGTRSVPVSFFAITGVATIVMCVLGSIQRIGFELGTAEALAGVMVIGLAVDYTVHLGHMFIHARHYFQDHDIRDLHHEKEVVSFNSRLPVSVASVRSMNLMMDPSKLKEEAHKEKDVYNVEMVYYAVDKMGMTVLAGAITTFLSAIFLLATTLAFFGKMSILISFTVFYSTLYAFFFFIPMLRVFGPGKRGSKSDEVQVTYFGHDDDREIVNPGGVAKATGTTTVVEVDEAVEKEV